MYYSIALFDAGEFADGGLHGASAGAGHAVDPLERLQLQAAIERLHSLYDRLVALRLA